MRFLILFYIITGALLTNANTFSKLTLKCVTLDNDQAIPNLIIKVDTSTYLSNSEGISTIFLKNKIYHLNIYDQDLLIKELIINLTNDTFIKLKFEKIVEFNIVKLNINKPIMIQGDNKLSIPQSTLESISLPLCTNDPIHLLKTLPGISTSQEMNAGLNVRGANAYNTVYYLDNIPVPNLSHSFGLFSFFDMNTIRHIDYTNKEVTAEYGNRGSSFIKFYLKDPLTNKNNAEISINPFFVSGNVNIKLKKDRIGLFINYRKSILNKTYSEILPLFSNFSDILLKLKYKINEKSNLTAIYAESVDKTYNDYGFGLNVRDSMLWRFKVGSMQYSRINKHGVSQDLSFFVKSQILSRQSMLYASSNISNRFDEYNLKYTMRKNVNRNYFFLLGIENQLHYNQNNLDTFNSYTKQLNIVSLFTDNSYQFKKFRLFCNLRVSDFVQIHKFYLEKRIGLSYLYRKTKLYIEMNDFVNNIQALSNNLFPIPGDYRFLPNAQFLPLITKEKLIGVSKSIKSSQFQMNGYYRNYLNSIDYKKLYSDKLNDYENITLTKQYSYGLESIANIQINKKQSTVVSYTYSRSFMENNSINNGLRYPANYDRPHQLYVLHSFKFKRFTFTSTFTFQSGRPTSIPLFLAFGQRTVYSNRNEYRLKPFNKLDIGFQYNFKNKGRIKQFFNFNIYNVYSRKNVYGIIIVKENKTNTTEFKYLTAFPILPSFSYTLRF